MNNTTSTRPVVSKPEIVPLGQIARLNVVSDDDDAEKDFGPVSYIATLISIYRRPFIVHMGIFLLRCCVLSCYINSCGKRYMGKWILLMMILKLENSCGVISFECIYVFTNSTECLSRSIYKLLGKEVGLMG